MSQERPLMPRIARTRFLMMLFAALALLAGCQSQISDSTSRWESQANMRPPTRTTIYICHAFGCKLQHAFHPSKEDIENLTSIMANGYSDAQAERKALGSAIQWFEKRVGPQVGSDKDIGGFDMQHSGVPGHMDCIDEASNSTSYMLFMQMHGLLKHHTVKSPVARGFFLDGRYPHATSVVGEKGKGKEGLFAIDSWKYDNGVYPDIKPLSVWFAERSDAS